tara:strand:+ start:1002 stop:1643 length:642 start_codon:yes stop_codon:yes gene_type:complete
MNNIKFINPLFDTEYFKNLFLSEIYNNIKNEFGDVINEWFMITLHTQVEHTQAQDWESTAKLEWTVSPNLTEKVGGECVGYISNTGEFTSTPSETKKSIKMYNFNFLDLADRDKLLPVCNRHSFYYVWFSVHIGPQEVPVHVDKKSGLRYIQCIYKTGNHTDWTYQGETLDLSSNDAFVFDPKFKHSIVTPKDCVSIFLIADCPQYTIEEWNV